MQLATLEEPRVVDVVDGRVAVAMDLPRLGVSLVVAEPGRAKGRADIEALRRHGGEPSGRDPR